MSTPLSPADLHAIATDAYPRVKRLMRSQLPEPECYDAAQEAMRAFLASDPARMQNPTAYLMGVARKHVLKYFERHRSTAAFDSTMMSVAQYGTSLSARLDRRNLLMHALRSLPADQQQAYQLRHLEGMSLEEVAEAGGVSLATVKRYLAAAQKSLEESLTQGDLAQLAEAYRRA